MIIWLNGAFGAGKTQTAFELQRGLKNSYVYDPENVGFFIRDNIPPSLSVPDFQDYPVWRRFNFEMLEYISQQYGGTVIVPMACTSAVKNSMPGSVKDVSFATSTLSE